MVSEEEVKQGLISAEDVGPPLAEDEHSEGAESLPDSDLVEDLIPDEDVEPSLVEEVTQPNVRPLDWRFFSSVQNYVKGLPFFRADKPLPGVVANSRYDQEVLNRLFRGKKLGAEVLPEVLGYDLSEPSLTVSNGGGKPHKIPFRTISSNPNFFLRLSDPSSYEHRKSLFLWKMVSSIRLQILNSILLRFILEELRMYAGTSEFDGNLAGVEKQEKELLALLGTTKWTRKFLTAKRCSNLLADKIWRALRDVHVPTGLMEDVLEDLRTRFKRGRIWENDPWWPNDR